MPHQSHDTNPIENLWAGIDKAHREHKISNKGMINQKNLEVWNSIYFKTGRIYAKSIEQCNKAHRWIHSIL